VFGNLDRSVPLAHDCYGAQFSGSYNVIGIGTGCAANGPGDLATANAGLGPLADNGGPSQTHALLASSPAIDRAPAEINGCGSTVSSDQRGVARPWNGSCDAGAFEFTVQTPRLYFPLTVRAP
jgi:hypothetical protein